MKSALASIERQDLDPYRHALDQAIGEGQLNLPLLPQVAGEVLSMLDDPNLEMLELSNLVHRDPVLAGHVLRVANSAAYGCGEAIVSLQQAITRLGMRLLSEIALAVSLKEDVFSAPGFESEIAAIWRHALASGVWSKEVARMKRHNVEGQFLCGLLHTIGKPVLLQTLVRLQKNIAQPLTSENAMGLVEEFHGAVGQRLAADWKLPRQIQICCAFYAAYERAPSFQVETAMACLGDLLATWSLGTEAGSTAALLEEKVFDDLNLYPDERQGLLDRRPDVLETVNAMDL